jgi:hypothetical protein
MDITPADIQSLADKIDGLDLTESERSILDGILDRAQATQDEVEGFGGGENAIIQDALRGAYVENLEDLGFYAQRIASVWIDIDRTNG